MKKNRINKKSLLLILLLWALIGLIHLMSGYLDTIKQNSEHVISFADFFYYLLAYMSWALLNTLLYIALSRIVIYQQLIRVVIIYFIGIVIWLPSFFIFDAQMASWVYDVPSPSFFTPISNQSNQVLFFYSIIYTLTFFFCAATIYYQHAKEVRETALELENKHAASQLILANMQMRELQSQLSPHFLFNCLSSVSALARNAKKNDLLTAITQLGDLLRFTIEASKKRLITLSSEIEFVENYIALQKLRFENRFSIFFEKSKIPNNLYCPPFLLQTLIENVFSHGVAKSKKLTKIKISITKKNNTIQFIIENTDNKTHSTSAGLNTTMKNLHERLTILFEENFYLFHAKINQHYKAEVHIPVIKNDNLL